MTEPATLSRPAWQTDELEDEWIDQDAEAEDDPIQASMHVHTTSDLSFTQPLGSVLSSRDDLDLQLGSPSSAGPGTFVIKEDVPAAPFLPHTPGQKKGLGKDFFSPLALEKMFEPPSPPSNQKALLPAQTNAPAVPSRLSQVYVPTHDDTEILDDSAQHATEDAAVQRSPEPADNRGPEALDREFTFAVPSPSPFHMINRVPEAQSTPGARRVGLPHVPGTDPRLRLFQFQYDTFTRDHLSAMVDSIAVNTPSGGSGTARSSQGPSPILSPIEETNGSRLRSAKRVKLSPASDFSTGDQAAVILRPRSPRKDYIGESRSLMEKIRQTRDFSTISTVATAHTPSTQEKTSSPGVQEPKQSEDDRRPSHLTVPPSDGGDGLSSTWSAASSSKKGSYSSLAYRQQAANLMAQIRNDMVDSKRLFSGETEMSHMQDESRAEKSVWSDTSEQPSYTSNQSFTATKARQNASPRKLLRRLSAADEVNRELAEDMSNMSLDTQQLVQQFPAPPPKLMVTDSSALSAGQDMLGHHNPVLLSVPTSASPTYPTESVRRHEDMTRFVSSSTASGTTLTAGSAESFVKHQGPHQMTRITPNDVPTLPDRVGKMVFDKVMMKWVKTTAAATVDMQQEPAAVVAEGDTESEDPFRDIESLQEDDSGKPIAPVDETIEQEEYEEDSTDLDKSRVQEITRGDETEDEEEVELTSFSFDGPPAPELAYAGINEAADDDAVESDSEDYGPESSSRDIVASHPGQVDSPAEGKPVARGPPTYPPGALMTPNPRARPSLDQTSTPVIRSAMKSRGATPVSALKDFNGSRLRTPVNHPGHRRSVSFSDGKHDGPIVGIGRDMPTPEGTMNDEDVSALAVGSSKSSVMLAPSARSKRIGDMLENLEAQSYETDSPSKTSSSGRPVHEELQLAKPRRPRGNDPNKEPSRRVFSRSLSAVKSPGTPGQRADATFLTECSFGVAHDRLVQVITDVQPFEPYWEQLTSIDLSNRNIDSVARLKEFLPRLDSLSLNSNQLSWLSGVPGSVRSLSVASNILTGVTSFSHLLNLEHLDISRNEIDTLRQLECLRHLRELRADGNRIDSIDGLQKMDGLLKLSLQENELREVDFKHFRWTRLEMLNLSQNRLASVEGLSSLTALIALNFDRNVLCNLEPAAPMQRLKILRVSGNKLQRLNAALFPNVRTLYADSNALGTIQRAGRLSKLENLSLRYQSARTSLSLSIRDVRDVRRLYLSGNPLQSGFLSEPCYNLVYLELARCRLTELPPDLANLVPNVRVLNLNYNFLEDIRPLEGLKRLRKLTVIGSRIKGSKQILRVLKGMQDVELLDFRMNPCTLGWYLPLLLQDTGLQAAQGKRKRSDGGSGDGVARSREQTEDEARGTGAGGKSAIHLGPLSRAPPSQSGGAHTGSAIELPGARGAAGPGIGGARGPGIPDAARAHGGQPGGGGLGGRDWKELDARFRRDLPDEQYAGRLAYRGMVMRTCPATRVLDGVEVSAKERDKAERLLEELARKRARGGEPGAEGTQARGGGAEHGR
ncbi:hypothetical protein OBBRIDRAFT_792626 [Obba rivulosa]|uniref:Septation initiation network scaffold protein cdc11 n=1 Tax=Obba rivulosa TaxID=1052685 RepID=A0A8E2AV22_9APHY|nr:hypothetical protein OBBRIDRAFT_792626 [Obba rivulosa]